MADAVITLDQQAPDFKAMTHQGESITLNQFKGHPVVLYFYPKDNTPGCTLEAKDFRDLYPTFQQHGIVVLGISRDSQTSHQKFCQQYQLPFPLLVDEQSKLCDLYGVIRFKTLFGKTALGIERTTFLIDREGIVRRIWRKVKVANHAQEVLEVAQTL